MHAFLQSMPHQRGFGRVTGIREVKKYVTEYALSEVCE